MASGLTRLEPSYRERIWGTTELSPWFPNPTAKTGEVWFSAGEDAPLLVKFIFTSENLSVQVHPPDDFAERYEASRGKTEMWHILEAQPGAKIALGFRQPITREQFEGALRNQTAEELLEWVPVQPGDTYFVQAGVVHAIGAGLTLCEIQQNSDLTYRLYDYGRARELHLNRGLAVSLFEPYNGRVDLPFECTHFAVEEVLVSGNEVLQAGRGHEHLWIVLEGEGQWNGHDYRAGEVWRVNGGAQIATEPGSPTRILAASS